jgi:tetrapyrrole methylase family protein/MazG family protein
VTPRVVVVGLGPAGPELLTTAAHAAIDRVETRFVRTHRHPAAIVLESAVSFDDLYDRSSTMEEVYAAITERLVAAANDAPGGEVLYAVPGSPSVAEKTVEALRADDRVDVEIIPGLSFLDLVWDRLAVDPLTAGVQLVDGHRFAVEAAGAAGPLLVGQCDAKHVLSAIKLAPDDGWEPSRAVILQRLGLPDEHVVEVAWSELDRAVEPDHLTSVWIPELAAPIGHELLRFAELVRTLRERCPWDREQTHASLAPYVLEEAFEVAEAIESGDSAHLEEELGDLLFQVYFHSVLGAEAGEFTLADVARGVHDKLVRRHPHVFGDVVADDAGTVVRNWHAIKQEEKARESALDGVPLALPALMRARKIQSRAWAVGFDWPSIEGVYDKVIEELQEVRDDPSADELGDLLFATVNLARHLGFDPESALRGATQKFDARFRAMEGLANERGLDLAGLSPADSDALWEDVKRAL